MKASCRCDVCHHCDEHSAVRIASGKYRCERCGRELEFRQVNYRTSAEVEAAKEKVRARAKEFGRTHSKKYFREHADEMSQSEREINRAKAVSDVGARAIENANTAVGIIRARSEMAGAKLASVPAMLKA